MSISIEEINAAQIGLFTHSQTIRREVFCVEQGVPESIEWDDLDAVCRHFLLWLDGAAVATARTRPYGTNLLKIERVAVLKSYRRRGLGRVLMEHILAAARASSADDAVLNAQTAVRTFYADLGFIAEGPEFIEVDIPHVHMRLKLR